MPKLCCNKTCRVQLPEGREGYCKSCSRAYHKNYYAADPEAGRQRSRKYRSSHPETHLDYGRRWDAANPNKKKARKHRRRARLAGCTVTDADMALVIQKSEGICAMCRSWVPNDLRHIDHIVPLDRGGPHSLENLQLLCGRCNCRKGTKPLNEVTPEQWKKKSTPAQPFLFNPNWR